VAKTKGRYKIGRPYQIKETWYYPAENFKYVETGIASWYGRKFHGKKTANGETYDMNTLTAAHRTLPLPSVVRVINLKNGRSLNLRVNDRGPFARGRIIDVSRRAAQLLDFQRAGTARVRVEIVAGESRRLKIAAINGQLPDSQKITGQAVAKQPVESQPISSTILPNKRERSLSDTSAQKTITPIAEVETQTVKRLPAVADSKLFIQAGAFADFDNASRARTRLSRFGPAWVTKAQIGQRQYYRVRIGPVQSLQDADNLLDRMISSGFPQARLVVD
jgi:rare lipoprotein A